MDVVPCSFSAAQTFASVVAEKQVLKADLNPNRNAQSACLVCLYNIQELLVMRVH